MNDITTTVTNYIDGWNEADPQRRAELLERTWADEASYVDPHFEAAGRDGIGELIGGVHQQYPGHTFVLVDGPDAHHDRVRFTWHLDGPDGTLAVGTDFATVADDGRLREVTGFLSPPA